MQKQTGVASPFVELRSPEGDPWSRSAKNSRNSHNQLGSSPSSGLYADIPRTMGERTQAYQFTEQTPGSPGEMSAKKLKSMIVQYEKEFKKLTQQMAEVHKQISVFQAEIAPEKRKGSRTGIGSYRALKGIRRTKTCRSPAGTSIPDSNRANKTQFDAFARKKAQLGSSMLLPSKSSFIINQPKDWDRGQVDTEPSSRAKAYLSGSIGVSPTSLRSTTPRTVKNTNSKNLSKSSAAVNQYTSTLNRNVLLRGKQSFNLGSSEACLLPASSNMKTNRSKRIRGWKKPTAPSAVVITTDSNSQKQEEFQSPQDWKDTPRDRSITSKSVIQTTPEEEDKRMTLYSHNVRRPEGETYPEIEIPRLAPMPQHTVNYEEFYQFELAQLKQSWAEELSRNLAKELERCYAVYEQRIFQIRQEISQIQEGLELLEYERIETESLVPRLETLRGIAASESAGIAMQAHERNPEVNFQKISELEQEIGEIKRQNQALRVELSIVKQPTAQTQEIAQTAGQINSLKASLIQTQQMSEAVRDAEKNLEQALEDLNSAERERKLLYDKLAEAKAAAEGGPRVTVSSRLENSLPMQPTSQMLESQLSQLLDKHNISLALEARDIQISFEELNRLEISLQKNIKPNPQQTRDPNHLTEDGEFSEDPASLESRSLQLERLLDQLIVWESQREQRQTEALADLEYALSAGLPAVAAIQTGTASFKSSPAQTHSREFSPSNSNQGPRSVYSYTRREGTNQGYTQRDGERVTGVNLEEQDGFGESLLGSRDTREVLERQFC